MNTIFTVTAGKGTPEEKSFTVDIGTDLVSTMTEDEIVKAAEDAKIISIQGKLRNGKHKDAPAMQEYLRKTYPNATVELGVVKTQSVNAKLKALEAILGKDEVARLLEQELAKRETA